MVHMLASNMSFMIGSRWMFLSFAKDIKSNWNSAEEMSSSKGSPQKFKQQIYKCIQIHSTAKELRWIRTKFMMCYFSCSFNLTHFCFVHLIFRFVSEFSSIYEFTITVYFVWSLLTICGTLLLVQIELVAFLLILFCTVVEFQTDFFTNE